MSETDAKTRKERAITWFEGLRAASEVSQSLG